MKEVEQVPSTPKNKKRTSGRLWFDMLTSIQKRNGPKKTKIMYDAYLSFNQINRHIDLLIKFGFVTYNDRNYTYNLTDKGLMYLKTYSEGLVLKKDIDEKLSEIKGLTSPNL